MLFTELPEFSVFWITKIISTYHKTIISTYHKKRVHIITNDNTCKQLDKISKTFILPPSSISDNP